MAAIETAALTKRYGDVVAVDGLDLTVRGGEIFGFLGPNGAGKSTTIDLLLGFVRPTAGSATVLGRDAVAESRAVRRRTGVLPEGVEPYGRLTAREHVAYAVETKDADDDPNAILERVGLADAADRKAGGFSKGMAQRLALGMALVGDPDLLVLDEPSSGLDPTGVQEMRKILRAEADRGTTVFFSSHVLPEVEAVCDRVGIMTGGSLVAVDTIEGLREVTSSRSRVTMTVDGRFDADALRGTEGVARLDVNAGGRSAATVAVECTDPAAKAAVVARAHREATVTDLRVEDASLEDLFNSYAGEPGDGGDDDGSRPAPAEGLGEVSA